MAFIDRIKEIMSSSGIEAEVSEGKGFIKVKVPLEQWEEAAKALASNGFDHVKTVTIVDYKARGVFEVAYHVSSFLDTGLAKYIIELSTEIPRDNPVVKSLVGIWPSAEFLERESFEFFGVVFEGHPDLRPILLLDEVVAKHPLRKDFVVKEEGIFR
ncbi:MAG: NADH-quinone oxidoreductase subunit C [Desulfurococcales archaeon]|nr:NADH-quinone oxidoreductase subunit C [Desulfurococcales archaeon]